MLCYSQWSLCVGHNTLVFSGILIPGTVAKKYTKECVFTDPFFFLRKTVCKCCYELNPHCLKHFMWLFKKNSDMLGLIAFNCKSNKLSTFSVNFSEDCMTSWTLKLSGCRSECLHLFYPLCRRFEESHISQIKTVFPEAYTFRQEKNIPTFNSSIKRGSYQLTVEPVILSG